jgi:hypothetical protein
MVHVVPIKERIRKIIGENPPRDENLAYRGRHSFDKRRQQLEFEEIIKLSPAQEEAFFVRVVSSGREREQFF